MIHPTCQEVLSTVQAALRDEIAPKINDPDARSSMATIEHLLRHVALRIDEEPGILSRDVSRLKILLRELAAWFDQVGIAHAFALRRGLREEAEEGGASLNLSELGEQALRLRGLLTQAQGIMREARTKHGHEPRYVDLHAKVLAYIAAQIEDEARLIAPAFSGRGPRR